MKKGASSTVTGVLLALVIVILLVGVGIFASGSLPEPVNQLVRMLPGFEGFEGVDWDPLRRDTDTTVYDLNKDTEPPAIEHMPVFSAQFSNDIKISAHVSDESGVRRVGVVYWATGSDAPGNGGRLMGQKSGTHEFEGEIPARDVPLDGIEYYIVAKDLYDNEGAYPQNHLSSPLHIDIIPGPDTDPPRVSNVYLETCDASGSPQPCVEDVSIYIGATITDNLKVGNELRVWVDCLTSGGGSCGSYSVHMGGDEFIFVIDRSSVLPLWIEYRICADDGAGSSVSVQCSPVTLERINVYADSDGDGLGDEQELSSGTNPNDPDSDNDGLNDKAEFESGCDPHIQDSDSDGILDGLDEGCSGSWRVINECNLCKSGGKPIMCTNGIEFQCLDIGPCPPSLPTGLSC